MTKSPVDFEKLFFFLKEDPDVYPQFRSLKRGDKHRSDEQLKRAVENNLAWAEELVPKMIQQAHIAAKMLQKEIERPCSRKGVDAWL